MGDTTATYLEWISIDIGKSDKSGFLMECVLRLYVNTNKRLMRGIHLDYRQNLNDS